MAEKFVVNEEEINLIKKIREIHNKKNDFNILSDLEKMLDVLDEIYQEQKQKYGFRGHISFSDKEIRNGFKIAQGRTEAIKIGVKKMGGRKSRIQAIQREIRSWGYSIFLHAEYVQSELESKYAKSTIYEALRKL